MRSGSIKDRCVLVHCDRGNCGRAGWRVADCWGLLGWDRSVRLLQGMGGLGRVAGQGFTESQYLHRSASKLAQSSDLTLSTHRNHDQYPLYPSAARPPMLALLRIAAASARQRALSAAHLRHGCSHPDSSQLGVVSRLDDIRAARLAGQPQEEAAIMFQARSLAAAQKPAPVRGKGKKAAQEQGPAGAASPDAKGGAPTAWLPLQGCWAVQGLLRALLRAAVLTSVDVLDTQPIHCQA